MGRAGGILYRMGGLLPGVLALKQGPIGSDPLSSVAMERVFIPGRGNYTRKRERPGGQGMLAIVVGQALDPAWSRYGEVRVRVLGDEVREGAEGLGHPGFKLQWQPRPLHVLHFGF